MFGDKVSKMGMRTATEKEYKEACKGYVKPAPEMKKPKAFNKKYKPTGF